MKLNQRLDTDACAQPDTSRKRENGCASQQPEKGYRTLLHNQDSDKVRGGFSVIGEGYNSLLTPQWSVYLVLGVVLKHYVITGHQFLWTTGSRPDKPHVFNDNKHGSVTRRRPWKGNLGTDAVQEVLIVQKYQLYICVRSTRMTHYSPVCDSMQRKRATRKHKVRLLPYLELLWLFILVNLPVFNCHSHWRHRILPMQCHLLAV